MRTQIFPIVIMALNLDTREKELKLINDWGFAAKPVFGIWKGKAEQSYVVVVKDPEQLQRLLNLAWSCGQEAVLYADDLRRSKLIYCNGDEESLGILQQVPPEATSDGQACTWDEKTNTFWMAR